VAFYFNRAASFTRHPKGLLEQIQACNSVHVFQFPLSRHDGCLEIVRAWRAEHRQSQVANAGRHPLQRRRGRVASEGARRIDDLQVRDYGHGVQQCRSSEIRPRDELNIVNSDSRKRW